jgi:hypothetical protein
MLLFKIMRLIFIHQAATPGYKAAGLDLLFNECLKAGNLAMSESLASLFTGLWKPLECPLRSGHRLPESTFFPKATMQGVVSKQVSSASRQIADKALGSPTTLSPVAASPGPSPDTL